MKKICFFTLIFTMIIIYPVFSETTKESLIKNKVINKFNDFNTNLIQRFADSIKKNDRVKYLDIGFEFAEKGKSSLDIKAVNKLKENKDSALFNQTSFTIHDNDETINFGIGYRKLLNDDLLMLGSNIFFDYQFDESHARTGLGVEAISSVFDLRGNYYNAISGYKDTDTGEEKALDGMDAQIDYHLPGKNDVNFFANIFEWKNSSSDYKIRGEKYGTNFKISNLLIEGGYLNDNKNNDGAFGSIKLVIPLGSIDDTAQNQKPFERVSVRDKLYQPVKRENKIKVVKISSGVTVSGY